MNIKFVVIKIFLLLFFTNIIKANDTIPEPIQNLGKDTVRVQVGFYNQKQIYHYIKKGETAFSIARFYGMTIEQLYYSNPRIENTSLKIGQRLTIPIISGMIVRSKKKGFRSSDHIPVLYQVKKKETLYTIGRKYFKMSVELLKKRNSLEGNELEVGQWLQVGWIHKDGIPKDLRQSMGKYPQVKAMSENLRWQYFKQKGRSYFDQGAASWQSKDRAVRKTSLYALHRKAKIGSILQVENPMNGEILYVKVLGRIPKSGYSTDVVVVLPPIVAKALGAIDPKFFVKIKYIR